MAKSTYCKIEEHADCNGKVVVGAPQPFGLEPCKCDCHRKEAKS